MSADRVARTCQPIPIPLREFALPSPLNGSIESHAGPGRQAQEGQEIHARVQRRRAKADPLYQAEVPIRITFEREGYRFLVEGRMDGLFRHPHPHIEEIKSTTDLAGLAGRLAEDPLAHPYGLQLLTYGYGYWCEHQVIPRLSFHLVSSRSGRSLDLAVPFDLEAYQAWLERRLQELTLQSRRAERRAARRRKVAAAVPFPFDEPRPGQVELMREIEEGLRLAQPMLIQAPTGLGKTMGVLYPVLKEALSRGQRVVYVTPKNSQHAVAEEAVRHCQQAGGRIRSLTLTAKGKLCFQNEPLCNPEVCEYARDYYTKLQQHDLPGLLAGKRRLKARLFRELGQQYRVCPFELQLECVQDADVLICDYNYVFAPRSALGRVSTLPVGLQGLPSLVIDEAHNLPSRAMDYYSPALSTVVLEKMREEMSAIHPRFSKEALELLESACRGVAGCRRGSGNKPERIDPPVAVFRELDTRLRLFLSRYLEADLELAPQDPVLRLCHSWADFSAMVELVSDPQRDEFFTTFHPHPAGGTIRITCCDASAMIRDRYGEYQQVVAFSATLKPFEYYARLCGITGENVRTAEFGSPFPLERRKLLVIPQISTRYGHRERNYTRVAEAIGRISALRPGNYLAFFPSFDFLERVAALFSPPDGFVLLSQQRGMRGSQIEAILEQLQGQGRPTIMFAVQGGSFSEGVDYAGEMVIGAFVVGPPLPNYDIERELMRDYYQRRYGAGFDYAYAIPAMAKAVQAAGRVIRSETDRGLIVLMDSRFTEPTYSRAMPADWFRGEVSELVSERILSDVAAFWSAAGERN